MPANTVTEAVRQRISTRAFLPDAISRSDLADLLEAAQRSPSGGNLQPWRTIAVTGEAKDAIIKLGPGKRYDFDFDKCTGCATCFEQCPCHAIEMIPEGAAHG